MTRKTSLYISEQNNIFLNIFDPLLFQPTGYKAYRQKGKVNYLGGWEATYNPKNLKYLLSKVSYKKVC